MANLIERKEYLDLIEKKFLELGARGANSNLRHADRHEWESHRAELVRSGRLAAYQGPSFNEGAAKIASDAIDAAEKL